jgi:hypothetical protein
MTEVAVGTQKNLLQPGITNKRDLNYRENLSIIQGTTIFKYP